MADITITIPAPTLTAGQYFKERHRQLPSGGWSGYTNRNNAPFTITGLSNGDYEFEFVLVNADGTQCPAVYRTYTLIPDYDCISFASEMKKVNGLFHIEVTYTLPPGHTDPACGWEIEYILNGNAQKFTLATLPAGGVIKIPCTNDPGIIYVRALMCNGRTKICHSNDITNFPTPPCVPFSNVVITIDEVQVASDYCEYYLNITFTQSVPATTQVKLNYTQWNHGLPQGDVFNGNVAISATANTFRKKLRPILQWDEMCMKYYVSFIDVCGNGNPVEVNFCRTKCNHETF